MTDSVSESKYYLFKAVIPKDKPCDKEWCPLKDWFDDDNPPHKERET